MRRIPLACWVLLLFVSNASPGAKMVEVAGTIDPDIPARVPSDVLREQYRDQSRGAYPWKMRPALYGFTESPAGRSVRMSNEGSPAEGLMIGWPSYMLDSQGHSRFPEVLEVIRHSLGRVEVSILARADIRPEIEVALRSAGIEPHKVEFRTFPHGFPDQGSSETLDSVWIRDYGPVFAYGRTEKGWNVDIIDMSYLPFQWYSPSAPSGRVRDDALPTRLGASMGQQTFRPRLIGEGGNLQTDGRGTCFTSDRLVQSNRNIFGQTHRLDEVLQRYFGCNRTIVLQALLGEATGHIDMFLSVVSPGTILIGSYDVSVDAANASVLNQNARKLKEAGYKVIRIPMPGPYSVQGRRVWATFANVLRVNDALLVPVYRNPKFPTGLRRTIRRQEAEALQKIRDAIPGVEIVPVASDTIILYGGALHCIAVTYPKAPAPRTRR